MNLGIFIQYKINNKSLLITLRFKYLEYHIHSGIFDFR